MILKVGSYIEDPIDCTLSFSYHLKTILLIFIMYYVFDNVLLQPPCITWFWSVLYSSHVRNFYSVKLVLNEICFKSVLLIQYSTCFIFFDHVRTL